MNDPKIKLEQLLDGMDTGWIEASEGRPGDMTQDVTVRVDSSSSAMIDQAKDEAETN